jgi:PST family polysaccharide transporter
MRKKLALFLRNKVVENYFSITLIQVVNLLIGLLLYPYLIKFLGKDAMGSYVFATAIILLFKQFISSGFNMPALKTISLNYNNLKIKNITNSQVFTSKTILFVFSIPVFVVLLLVIPQFRANYMLYIVVYTTLTVDLIFPIWYFQGIQNMKVVTFIQIGTKLLYIPFIFIFIKSSTDLLLYAVLISLSSILGAIISLLYLKKREKLSFHFVRLQQLKPVFKDAVPFFANSVFYTAKEQGLPLIIGSFFGMAEVAVYDLANKIINLLRILTSNINEAIFPKIVAETVSTKIKKIIYYETLISLVIIVFTVFFGYWIVLFLGGKDMITAYPLAIILSITIYEWLVVECYFYFVFIPQEKYLLVTKNQFITMISFIMFSAIGLLCWKNIFAVVLSYVLSYLVSIFYCKHLMRRIKI